MRQDPHLNQEEQVRVLTLRGSAMTFPDVVMGDVNTLTEDQHGHNLGQRRAHHLGCLPDSCRRVERG